MIKDAIAVVNDFSGGQDTKTPIISMPLSKSPNMRNFHCAGSPNRLIKRGGFAKVNSGAVGSDEIDTYYPPGYQTYDYPVRSEVAKTQISQGFKPKTSAAVQKVRLWLKKTSTPTGNINVEIQTDSSGKPSKTAVSNGTSANIDVSTLTTSYAWYTFTFTTKPTLTSGTQYHIVLQGSNTINGTAYANWGSDDYDLVFADGSMSHYDGTTWTVDSRYQAVFELYTTGGAKGNDSFALWDFNSKNMLLGLFGITLYKMDKNSSGTPDGTWDNLYNVTTEMDYCEYATDAAAQAAYVSSSSAVGLDANTHLLMHMDGANDGTTFGDSSTASNKGNATVIATVQTKTATKKWGTASALFDGDSGYLTYADSADWNVFASNADNWTIDFWVKHTDHLGDEAYVVHFEDGNHYWYLVHKEGQGVAFVVSHNGIIISIIGGEITDTNWHHIAMCKVANEYGLYKDGSQVGYATTDSTLDDVAALLSIGRYTAGVPRFFDGYIDELSIQNSNTFGAAPNATPDDTITVPLRAYPFKDLESYSESTIKQQGTYSLKGVATTGALNKTLTYTLGSAIDLSNENTLKFDIRSSRTGSNIKIGIHDSGGTTTEVTPNITVANVWQTVTLDMSSVSNANKDDIDSIIITIVNADATNTFYFDNFYVASLLTSSRNFTFADWQSGRALINTDVGLYTYTGTGNVSSVSGAPIGKFITVWKNYVFMAGIRGSPNVVRYSDLSDYTTWTAANTLNFDTNDGDVITGIRVLKGKLYVFKRYSVHRISYLGSNPTFQTDPILGIGSPAHYTVKEVDMGGELGSVLIFLTSDKKLAIFDGYNIQVINDSLSERTNDLFASADDQPKAFSDMNLVYADLFHATVKRDTYEYILYCVLNGSTSVNYAFVLDYKTGGIYPYDNQVFASSCYVISTNKAKLLYCAGYTGYMWQMESGNDDDGTAINAYWVSGKIKPQVVSMAMKMLQAGVNIKEITSTLTMNINFQYRIDWNVSWTTAIAFSFDHNDELAFGKTALFDIGTVENMFQVKLQDNSKNPASTIYGVDLYGEKLGHFVGSRATS